MLIFWIAAINVLVVTFFKYREIERINADTKLYINMKSNFPHYQLPYYIKITKNYKTIHGFRLFKIYNSRFIYLDNKYITKGFKRFILTLLLWEFALSFLLIFMVYVILKRFLKKERDHKQFLRFLLGAISHKFGNFLSIQRINLELIETENKRPLDRLRSAHNFMERDFRAIVDVIKETENSDDSEKCEASKVIKDTLDLFKERLNDKQLSLSLSNAQIDSGGGDFYNVIHELIENSIRYSKNYIYIKTIKKKKYIYIMILNDIGNKKSGSGFGLSLVKYLSSKNNWHFETKLTDGKFQAALIVKK